MGPSARNSPRSGMTFTSAEARMEVRQIQSISSRLAWGMAMMTWSMPCWAMRSSRSSTTPRTGEPSMCLPTSTGDLLTKPTTCVSDAAVRQMCPASATPGSPVPTITRPRRAPGSDDHRPRPAPDLPQGHLVEDPRIETHGDELHIGEYGPHQRYRERDGV